jgi:hypothetical protein
MADQFLTISIIARDNDMTERVAACAAQQGQELPHRWWAEQNAYTWASAPGWGAKWDSAVAGGVEHPGADPAVITDGDILAVIQPMVTGG